LLSKVFQSVVPPLGRLFILLESKFPENDDKATPPCVDATHAGLFANVFQSTVPPLGRLFILLESKFPENDDNATPPCVDATHDGTVPPLGKFVIPLESTFPENEDNVTPPCVDVTHTGLFISVFQSSVEAEGKLYIRESSRLPLKLLKVTAACRYDIHCGRSLRLYQPKSVTRVPCSEPPKFVNDMDD
jgi:hypothetical protein